MFTPTAAKSPYLNTTTMNGENGLGKKPATYADVRKITGAQGSGKSTVAVAFGVEDHYRHLNGLQFPNGEILPAISVDKSVNLKDYLILKKSKIYPNILKYVRLYSPDGRRSKLIQIPKGCRVVSPIKIFSNFTFYGIEYVPITLFNVVENINSELFNDAWVMFDESVETDARRSMMVLEREATAFYASVRKRRAHFCAMSQTIEQLERRIRLFATWTVLCSYDEELRRVYCEMTIRGQKKRYLDFYAPRYWPFFDTQEIVKVPQYRVDRTLASVTG